MLFIAVTIFARRGEGDSSPHPRRQWAVLTLLIVAGWCIGPDNLGGAHGAYLRDRILLLGLVTVVPILKLDLKESGVRIGAVALMIAIIIQSATVWDYALTSNRLAGNFMQAKPYVGTNHRIGTLKIFDFTRFIGDPVWNLENMFGIGTGNLIWSNYEAGHYVFPVKYRDQLDYQRFRNFRSVNNFILTDPKFNADDQRDKWARLLAETNNDIDVLVVWGSDPRLDAINAQWFGPEPVFEGENVRVFRHR